MRPLLMIAVWMMAGCGGCSVLFCAIAARAQSIVGLSAPGTASGHVHFAPESVDVAAHTPTPLELRFFVDEGFHINSNKPTSELLLPTLLSFEPAAAVRVVSTEYPRGEKFRLEVGGGETLDVYQKDFRLRLQVVAEKGESTLRGTLHYQACDKAACFPPRTLPVTVLIHAK